MGEVRDAARTRAKILTAARDEFAARGFAGARVESIAKRAGLTKQLIYHYFPSKEALFEETLQAKYQRRRTRQDDETGPGELFRQRFRYACEDTIWMRLMTWEAAEHRETGRIIGEDTRRASVKRLGDMVAERQARGDLPADLPAEMIELAIYALSIYPIAFSQTTEMVTGRPPEDPEFQAEWSAFLEVLARRLAKS
ncbi:TetR/AcrR family transcriptional regulator [Phenylobacterium sp.]|uniref:TetR/AcrR family transcriptional regulator n=1 Tax=Phenylobacterium sp. TaxID=1871053 RepID=UPI0035B47EEE